MAVKVVPTKQLSRRAILYGACYLYVGKKKGKLRLLLLAASEP